VRKPPWRWELGAVLIRRPTTSLLHDVPLARIESAANADPGIRRWLEKSHELTAEVLQRRERKRFKLRRPARRRLDDEFYRDVARAYVEAVAHGLPPAKTLAEDSETPPGTVNRWIAEARKPERQYLPPAEPGKVSA
jgi:hypothetical protein